MKKAIIFLALCFVVAAPTLWAQTQPPLGDGPWKRNLMMRTGSDGNSFGSESKFADSAGVPSLLKDSKGRILAAFQWFPAPANSTYWDKVAVKISEDGGKTWTKPQPIVVSGIPSAYQRPFDPTLALTEDGRIRIFFSSSPNSGTMLDSSVATYSAISSDGVNYTFETGARFSVGGVPIIDPAALRIGSKWHYTAPQSGKGLSGAYYATSTDGLTFTRGKDISAGGNYNWTGNLMEYGAGMRFYGTASGASGMWWSYSADGSSWSAPASLGIGGGDPACVKISDNNYLIVYVSDPVTAVEEATGARAALALSPNPVSETATVRVALAKRERARLALYNALGQEVLSLFDGELDAGERLFTLSVAKMPEGAYFLRLRTPTLSLVQPVQVFR